MNSCLELDALDFIARLTPVHSINLIRLGIFAVNSISLYRIRLPGLDTTRTLIRSIFEQEVVYIQVLENLIA